MTDVDERWLRDEGTATKCTGEEGGLYEALSPSLLAGALVRWPLARKPPDQGVNFPYGLPCFQIIVIHHLVISSDPPFTISNSVTVEESLLAAVSDVGEMSLRPAPAATQFL